MLNLRYLLFTIAPHVTIILLNGAISFFFASVVIHRYYKYRRPARLELHGGESPTPAAQPNHRAPPSTKRLASSQLTKPTHALPPGLPSSCPAVRFRTESTAAPYPSPRRNPDEPPPRSSGRTKWQRRLPSTPRAADRLPEDAGRRLRIS
jgi:hypothetical protein